MAAADYQTMLRRVQETDYHTDKEEQEEVESMGWDINFPVEDKFMERVNADVESYKDELTKRANSGELSEDEANSNS